MLIKHTTFQKAICIDKFSSKAVKSSEGHEDWLTFFKMCSAAISHLEGGRILQPYSDYSVVDLRAALMQYAIERTFFQKMSNIGAVADIVRQKGANVAYCLLELNVRQGQSTFYGFQNDQFELANAMYTKLEQSSACGERFPFSGVSRGLI